MMNQLYLYVALIGLAFVLYALTRTKGTAPPAQVPERPVPAAVDQELKDLLDDFMNELERDNVKLIDGFTKLQIEHKEQITSQNKIIRTLEKRIVELETKLAEAPPASVLPPQEAPAAVIPAAPLPAVEEEPQPTPQTRAGEETAAQPAFVMQEKYAHVLALSRQGLAPEQIARETGIGVGEILLVIGLAKRGEA